VGRGRVQVEEEVGQVAGALAPSLRNSYST